MSHIVLDHSHYFTIFQIITLKFMYPYFSSCCAGINIHIPIFFYNICTCSIGSIPRNGNSDS